MSAGEAVATQRMEGVADLLHGRRQQRQKLILAEHLPLAPSLFEILTDTGSKPRWQVVVTLVATAREAPLKADSERGTHHVLRHFI